MQPDVIDPDLACNRLCTISQNTRLLHLVYCKSFSPLAGISVLTAARYCIGEARGEAFVLFLGVDDLLGVGEVFFSERSSSMEMRILGNNESV